MARKRTHTLTISGKHTYPMADIEGRRLPELVCTLVYDGVTEDGDEYFTASLKTKYAGQRLLDDLSEKLKRLLSKKEEMAGRGFKTLQRAAIDWCDQRIADFLESGLFSIAVLDASKAEEGRKKGPVYEYEPELQVVKARVYKV